MNTQFVASDVIVEARWFVHKLDNGDASVADDLQVNDFASKTNGQPQTL